MFFDDELEKILGAILRRHGSVHIDILPRKELRGLHPLLLPAEVRDHHLCAVEALRERGEPSRIASIRRGADGVVTRVPKYYEPF